MKSQLDTLFSIFMIALLCLSVQAQTLLQGVVTDTNNKSKLPFATVAVYQNGTLITGTDTDFDGIYMFSNLEPGAYDLDAAFVGYATNRIDSVIIKADTLNKLDFELEEARELDYGCCGCCMISQKVTPIVLFKGKGERRRIREKRRNSKIKAKNKI